MRFACLIGSVCLATAASPALAFDHSAFCSEMIRQAEADQLESGLWLDEITRQDTVTVHCSMRMIEFRRHLELPSSDLGNEWRANEKRRWNESHCTDPNWREAIRNGWTVASTLITSTGESIWYAASCR